MTPADYLCLIVLPTLAECIDTPDDQRRAYLACITTAHLVDHVSVALDPTSGDRHAVRRAVRAVGPYSSGCLDIVEAVSNGTKHAAPDPKPSRPVKFAPGYERFVPAFSWNTPGAGWGEARWSGPGIVVDHDGAHWFIDDCVRATVRAYAVAFPALFADADLGPVARELDRYVAFDAMPLTPPGTTP
jgi:hypothetical protein